MSKKKKRKVLSIALLLLVLCLVVLPSCQQPVIATFEEIATTPPEKTTNMVLTNGLVIYTEDVDMPTQPNQHLLIITYPTATVTDISQGRYVLGFYDLDEKLAELGDIITVEGRYLCFSKTVVCVLICSDITVTGRAESEILQPLVDELSKTVK